MKKYLFLILFVYIIPIANAQKPNVIFIMVDDMGYGDLGAYGQKLIETPNLNQLAASGMKFTQFYAGTSVCAPSRASLLTGLHTGHTPIRGNFEIEPEGQFPLPDSLFNIAKMFKGAGYQTGAFGKWGMGYPGSEGDPVKQGFDVFYGYNCQRQSHNYFPDHLWSNTALVPLKNTLISQAQYAPDLIQKKAIDFLNENKNSPFFLYLPYTLPHAGLQLSKGDQLFEYYKKKFNEQPRIIKNTWNGIGYQPQAYPHAAYATMVGKIDEYVGEVLQNLKKLGIEKNTLIIFTSDNGPHVEGGNDPTFFNSAGNFKGVKRQLYEGGIRTPLIVSWPGTVKPMQTTATIGAFWDFLPTFSDLIEQKNKHYTDGISLLPTFLNKPQKEKHSFLYWEFHEDGGRQAVRLGKWKGVKEKAMNNADATIELYDLDKDPAESKNLAKDYPVVLKQVKEIMAREHVENKKFPFFTKK